MAKSYVQMKERHQKEVDEFPIGFAFNDRQFEKAMANLGLNADDTDKILSVGAGGFIRKEDEKAFAEMFERHEQEMKEAIEADETGEGFIYDMFLYELGNHEYIVTGELDDTLDALNLPRESIKAVPSLEIGLQLAIDDYLESFDGAL